MHELSYQRQEQINGGSALTYIIYALLGIAGVKLMRASRGYLRYGRITWMK